MALDLDNVHLNRHSHVHLNRQLADAIRRAIEAGELEPNEQLPSEAEFQRELQMSRNAIRQAMDVLIQEGLLVRRKGSPTRVAPRKPARRLATARYRREYETLLQARAAGEDHPALSGLTVDYNVPWDRYSVTTRYANDTATEADAERFAIPVGTQVLRRHFVKYVEGEPVQLQESVLPWELVKDTPVADPHKQPWPGGTMAELHSLGLVITRVEEKAWARMPTDEERNDLDMDVFGPVWEIQRRFMAGDKPVEVSEVICSAARNYLWYETDLSDLAAQFGPQPGNGGAPGFEQG